MWRLFQKMVLGVMLYYLVGGLPAARIPSLPDYLRPTQNVRLSFVGDCTLGSEERYQEHARNFVAMVKERGMDYPFSGVRDVFYADDLTLINLEGVFTDRKRGANKTFLFRAPTSYASILKQGGIEAVNLANNHTADYFDSGLLDTKAALDAQGVRYAGDADRAIYEVKGVRIGLLGYSYPHEDTRKRMERDIPALRAEGCDIVIVSMHAGREEQAELTGAQVRVAHRAITLGADVVVGHHPHVLQRVEMYQGKPIFYSLGNFSFGGNADPSDWDTAIAQVEFRKTAEGVQSCCIRILPCVISTATDRNDYRPVLADAARREAILQKLRKRSGDSVDAALWDTGVLWLH